MTSIYQQISQKLGLDAVKIKNTIELISNGCSIPFISRYRKEITGGLDEVAIASISKENERLNEIIKRKDFIIKTIEDQGKITDSLRQLIEECWDTPMLEDIYLPFKTKRRTKAQIAIEKGLEPLAKIIMAQRCNCLSAEAESFVSKEIECGSQAIEGALNIIAEWISESNAARNAIRKLFRHEATIVSKVAKDQQDTGTKFSDYFNLQEPLKHISSHRLLAIRRGEKEGVLKVEIVADEAKAISFIENIFVKTNNECGKLVCKAIKDSYKRLIKPSIETEFAATSKEKADHEAILIFAKNLRQLLLAPPLGQKRVLAIDPGFRTGCKITILDEHGNLLHNDTIYPNPPVNKTLEAMKKVSNLVEMYKIDAIAIGNGTAGRETEDFVNKIRFGREINVFVVNESGASIYSASKIAREEFPEYDVTVRGSVSLGRRLMDPLAELVKIDPKSIGVGQYQHDVNQKKLKESLDFEVMSCVNNVGVNLNTASKYLLTYISGVGSVLAQNIVDYRAKNGAFKNRKELLDVPKMGAISFEQCAGFMRIENSENPLDNSAVHPERYAVVEKIAKDLNTTITNLMFDNNIRKEIDINKYVSKDIGRPTLLDILKELERPTRDPRKEIKAFSFDKRVKSIEDLKIGMKLTGIVTNITKFGAFVDLGIHTSGLVHISQIANRFVADPTEVLSLNQKVEVTVLDIDLKRNRIQLSLIE